MAGIGFFLGGLGQSFQSAYNASAELALQKQQMRNQQQRELYARADKDMSALWERIDATITAFQAAGVPPEKIAQSPAIGALTQALTKTARLSGRDTSNVSAQIGAMLARPTSASVMARGQQQQQTAQSQPAQQAPQAPPAPGPVPFMNTAGQPASDPGSFDLKSDKVNIAPDAAQPPPVPDQHADFTNEINRLTQAMALAATPAEKEAYAIRLREAVHEKLTSGAEHIETKQYKDADGNEHIIFINKKTKQVMDDKGNPWVPPTGAGDNSDIKMIVQAIKEGHQPPITTGTYRKAAAIRAEAERQGLDLTQMGFEYAAAVKQIQSLNGPQMVRFAGLAKSYLKTIGEVTRLAQELQLSGVTWANAAELAAAKNTAGNTELGQKITQYIVAVKAIQSELAQLEKGGYDPTETAFKLALDQIDPNFGDKQMIAALDESRRIIRFRLLAIPNWQSLGPGAENRYVPGSSGNIPPEETPTPGGGAKEDPLGIR